MNRYRLAVIIGSTREGRIGPSVAGWFRDRVEERGDADLDMIDLAELALPTDLSGGGDTPNFAKRIDAAEAVAIVTPEYNHGYPAPLKTAIDTLLPEWQAKPIGFVSYGGVSGGLRAVEQLRTVFSEVDAVTVRATVSFQLDDLFDAEGNPRDSERARAAAHHLLGQLGWWAVALRHGRARELYPA